MTTPIHSVPPIVDTTSLEGALALTELGVIQVQGEDAAKFLHAQLTQDIQGLNLHQARLGALCSAKGRMLASFLIIHNQPETYWLICSLDILEATLKRLKMFVLRAKVSLNDITAISGLIGIAGNPGGLKTDLAQLTQPYASQPYQDGLLIRLPDSRIAPRTNWPRYLWIGPATQVQAMLQTMAPLSSSLWGWLDVTSAIARITQPTIEQFVPQMVNFELVGGINFKKGCYPGQEIVARSQYLGKLKRRATLAYTPIDEFISPAAELYGTEDPREPCGMVVNAAPHPLGGYTLLIELKLSFLKADDSGLHLGSVNGPPVYLAELPYELELAEEPT